MSTLDNVHKQVLNSILRRDNNSGPAQHGPQGSPDAIAQKDAELRQAVSDLYMTLSENAAPDQAIDILATHVAMMVEMINEFKSKR